MAEAKPGTTICVHGTPTDRKCIICTLPEPESQSLIINRLGAKPVYRQDTVDAMQAEIERLKAERDEWKQHAEVGAAVRIKELADLASLRAELLSENKRYLEILAALDQTRAKLEKAREGLRFYAERKHLSAPWEDQDGNLWPASPEDGKLASQVLSEIGEGE